MKDETSRLGDRIRILRKSKGLTLNLLSNKSGVSRAALSKIERGNMSPTYSTLRKIASALDLTVAALVLFDDFVFELEVVKADARKTHSTPHYLYEMLAGSSALSDTSIYISEILTCEKTEVKEKHTHNSRDFLLVLQGKIACHFEDRDTFYIEEGDTLAFDGRIPHLFMSYRVSDNDTNAKALWVSKTCLT